MRTPCYLLAALLAACGSSIDYTGDGDEDPATDGSGDAGGDVSVDPGPEPGPDVAGDPDAVDPRPDPGSDPHMDPDASDPIDDPDASETVPDPVTDEGGPPPGTTCDSAIDASAGGTWHLSYSDYSNLWSGGSGCGYAAGPEIWFTATVPDGHLFTLEEGASTEVTLQMLTACPSTTCIGSESSPEIIHYLNDTGSAVTLWVAVDAWWTSATGPVDVTVTIAASAPGTTCDTAIDMSSGGTWSGSFVGYADFWTGGSGCGWASGPEIWFTATVPDGNLFKLAETTTTDVTLQLLTSCPGTTCIANETGPEVIPYLNDTGSAVDVWVAVENWTSTYTRPVNVSASNAAAPNGVDCAHAIDVSSVTSWTGDFAPYADMWTGGSGCAWCVGPEVWFRAVVPGSNTFTMTETSGTNVVIDRLGSCTTTCAAGTDSPETLAYTNTTLTPQTVYYVLEHRSGTGTSIALDISNVP
jgi:hypothetical protein